MVREILPAAWLAEYIRSYHHVRMRLGTQRVMTPVTARPEQMMQFSFGHPFAVFDRDGETWSQAPDVVVIGRQTRRNFDLVATNDVELLTVHFQPAGFYRLFGLPMPETTNLAPNADDVLGADVRRMHERASESPTGEAKVAIIERYLSAKIDASLPAHPVEAAANRMLCARPEVDVAAMAASSYLSVRHFERVFQTHIGVAPKLFGRIARFAATIQAKTAAPHRSWASVATSAGYYDQMHFVRDCRSFASLPPSQLLRQWIDCRP
ncbi:MAG: helix-turn-helix domain-containing protein [Actinomycetota bacterium]